MERGRGFSMRQYVVSALLLSCLVGCVNAEDDVDEKDVTVLTDQNFEDFIEDDLVLVEFYAPWCGHCKALRPAYATAATELSKNKPPIKLGKLDATEYRDIAGKYDVSGYPTLKIFRNGVASPYEGGRESGAIVSYMQKQVGPAAKPVTSLDDLNAWVQGKRDPAKLWVVGMFDLDQPVSQLYSAFLLIAPKLRSEFVFLKCTSKDILDKYKVSKKGALYVFLKDQDEPILHEGDTSRSAVERFIRRNSLPVLGIYNKESADDYKNRGAARATLYLSVDPTSAGNAKSVGYYKRRVKHAAEQHRDDIVFALAHMDEFSEEMEQLGVKGKAHALVIEQPPSGGASKSTDSSTKVAPGKYVLQETFNRKNVDKFVEQFRRGEAEKFVKSEEEPASNNGPVKVVTGRSFDRIVNDRKKNVMIEFYAPWCGHCKALAPKYEELGRKMKKKYKNVVVAKLDATANDYPPEFEVSGYPTIYFVPAKRNAEPIKYEGDREVSELRRFIKKKSRKLKKKKKRKKKKQ